MSTLAFTPTMLGIWCKARLKEELDPELYDQIDAVEVVRHLNDELMSLAVRRLGRAEAFVMHAVYRHTHKKNANRMLVDKAELARLILFLQ